VSRGGRLRGRTVGMCGRWRPPPPSSGGVRAPRGESAPFYFHSIDARCLSQRLVVRAGRGRHARAHPQAWSRGWCTMAWQSWGASKKQGRGPRASAPLFSLTPTLIFLSPAPPPPPPPPSPSTPAVLLPFYEDFIAGFAHRMSPLRLAHVAGAVAAAQPGPEESGEKQERERGEGMGWGWMGVDGFVFLCPRRSLTHTRTHSHQSLPPPPFSRLPGHGVRHHRCRRGRAPHPA
jgi:hypothetical protein